MNIRKDLKNQQGIAHLMMIGLIVVVVAVVAAVGIMVSHKSKTADSTAPASSSSTKAAAKTADASCLATYKDANLCHFSSNSNSLDKTPYKATLTITSPSNGDSSMVLLNDGKGNNSIVTTGSGQSFSSITLDGNTYVQVAAGGAWTQYPSSSAPTTDPTSSMNIGVGASGIYFKYVATEACGSLSCYKYSVTDNATPGTTQYVWFDKSKYRLQEWSGTTADGTTDMKITYQSVNITKPSPIQQL